MDGLIVTQISIGVYTLEVVDARECPSSLPMQRFSRAYDDGSYSEGDLVLESVGNNHLPWSDIGTEMLLVFESPNGQYLDNQLEDGTCFHLGMPFFSAVAEMSASEWETAEVLGLVEMIPEMRAA